MLDEHRLHLQWVLRTHEHDSRMPGEAETLQTLSAPRIAHQVPSSNAGLLAFGNEHLRVIATPGHTSGCLSFLWHDRLFCGDLLAVDVCPYQPRPALPEALWDSVTHKVFTLPAETLLISGHAQRARSVSNVLEQRRWHPWFGGAVGSRHHHYETLMTTKITVTPYEALGGARRVDAVHDASADRAGDGPGAAHQPD